MREARCDASALKPTLYTEKHLLYTEGRMIPQPLAPTEGRRTTENRIQENVVGKARDVHLDIAIYRAIRNGGRKLVFDQL